MYLIKFFALLHFESFPRKLTSEFTVSCLMGFSLNGRRTKLSPDVNSNVGGWTLSTVPHLLKWESFREQTALEATQVFLDRTMGWKRQDPGHV